MATMADVARHAGVSASTVSYALSGKRPIAEETRVRIEQAITELGFSPNAGARALASSRTHVLGLFVQFLPDEFSPAMLQYVLPISDAARAEGYDILMVTEADGAHALQHSNASQLSSGAIARTTTKPPQSSILDPDSRPDPPAAPSERARRATQLPRGRQDDRRRSRRSLRS